MGTVAASRQDSADPCSKRNTQESAVVSVVPKAFTSSVLGPSSSSRSRPSCAGHASAPTDSSSSGGPPPRRPASRPSAFASDGNISSAVPPVRSTRSSSSTGSVTAFRGARTIVPPRRADRAKSAKNRSVVKLVIDTKRSGRSRSRYSSAQASHTEASWRCSTATPFGLPVDPEVYMT